MKYPIEPPTGVAGTWASTADWVRSLLLVGATFTPWLIMAVVLA